MGMGQAQTLRVGIDIQRLEEFADIANREPLLFLLLIFPTHYTKDIKNIQQIFKPLPSLPPPPHKTNGEWWWWKRKER